MIRCAVPRECRGELTERLLQIVETLRSDQAGFDLCLLDIHMVRTDGRQIARLLRAQSVRFCIVAVTGTHCAGAAVSS